VRTLPSDEAAEGMGKRRRVDRAKLFCGVIADCEDVVARVKDELVCLFGPVDLESNLMRFEFTDYYREEMGGELLRKFLSFADLIDPGELADAKTRTNALERELAFESNGRVRRRANLDPGYVTASKLVLATTKDFYHRVYLRDGIYAEVTLNFVKQGCKYFDWTYPDFRSGKYTHFFLEVRRRAMSQSG